MRDGILVSERNPSLRVAFEVKARNQSARHPGGTRLSHRLGDLDGYVGVVRGWLGTTTPRG
jgi:hypothetical protein